MSLMSPIRLMALIGLIGLIGSCTDHDDLAVEATRPAEAVIGEVRGYTPYYDETILSGSPTRAWAPPSGYTAYEDGDMPISIAFTQDDVEPQTGHFFKSSGKWRTNIDEIEAGNYFLYGYIPNNPGIAFSVTDRDGTNAHYSSGARVSLQNVPAVMPNNLCVVIGAKDGTDAETVTGLRKGDFAYNAKAISSNTDGGNYVFLLFDHLYAALRIKMRVHGDYDALRTIKLKSLSLKIEAGETTSATKTDIVIDLKATDGTDPIQSITYTPNGEAISEPLEFWSSAAGDTLTTSYSTFTGHFMPQDITTLVLTSVYDVYDKKGNLLRQDCKATNTMALRDLLTEQTTTRRGCRYTINMTIKPTYLYVLSEPDLNNPTVTID